MSQAAPENNAPSGSKSSASQSPGSRKRLKNMLIGCVCALLVYTLAGFFLVPFAARKIMVSQVKEQLGVDLFVEKIAFNPYLLTATLENITLTAPENVLLFSGEKFHADLSSLSIVKLAPVITQVVAVAPSVHLQLDPDGHLVMPFAGTGQNSSSDGEHREITGPQSLDSDAAGQSQGRIFPFKLTNLKIIDASLYLADQARGVEHKVTQFSLDLPWLSSLEIDQGTDFNAGINFQINQSPVSIALSGTPFNDEMDTLIHVQTSGIDLAPYTRYLPLPDTLTLASAGRLDFNLDVGVKIAGDARDNEMPVKLSINGQAGFSDFDLKFSDGKPLFSLPRAQVALASENILAGALKIEEILVKEPQFHLDRDDQGAFALLSALGYYTQTPKEVREPESSGPGFALALNRAVIENAKVMITDHSVENKFAKTLDPITLGVENLIFDQDLSLGFFGKIQSQAQEGIEVKGHLSMRETQDIGQQTTVQGNIEVSQFQPQLYTGYTRSLIGDALKVGRVSLGSDFSIALNNKGLKGHTSAGHVAVSQVRLDDADGQSPIIEMDQTQLEGIALDLESQTLEIASASTLGGNLDITRYKDGRMNLIEQITTLIPPRDMASGPSPDDDPGQSKPGQTNEDPPGWQATLSRFHLENWDIRFLDQSPKTEPVQIKLADIQVDISNLSTARDSQAGVKTTMTWQDKGTIAVDGNFGLFDPRAALDLDLAQINIQGLEPYFTQYLKIKIEEGHILSKGRLDFSMDPNNEPSIRYTGEAGLGDFISKNKVTGNDFFKCKSLYLTGMDVSVFPVKVNIKEIALTDYFSRGILLEQGELNINQILNTAENGDGEKTGQAAAAALPKEEKAKSEIPDINIDTVTVQGGHVNFTDYFTKPNFTANMTQIAGSIKGLSSTSNEPAVLQLKGLHGQHAPLDISGNFLFFAPEPQMDMKISFKNIDLTSFNPYATRFLGQEIEQGKLMLDLTYAISGNKLESSNKILFDQFDLGKRVESEEATSLPVGLAISLLKNPDGTIDLDIPITGELDDPEFSYGGLVMKAFANIILGVVTAPFKFLGSLLPDGGGDLGFVAFNPGSDVLTPETMQKLDQLAQVLADKPSLNLAIEGAWDADLDTPVLRGEKYTAQVFNVETGQDKYLGPREQEKRIRKAYEIAEFPKPRDEKGKEKEISLVEKEKLLITHIDIDDSELSALGQKRGQVVRDYIIGTGKLGPERLYLHSPNPVKETDKGNTVKMVFAIQ